MSSTGSVRQKEQDYLEVFQEVTRLIASVHDPQQVMELVVVRLPELLDLDAATVRTFDDVSGSFVLQAAHGLSDEYLGRDIIDTEEVMAALRAGQPTAINLEDRSGPLRYAQHREGLKGTMSLPILHKGEVIGILRLLTRQHRDFTDAELRFTMSLAEQIGLAIVNTRMYHRIREHDRFLQTVLDSLWLQVLVVGRQQDVLLINRNFLEMKGMAEQDVLGRPYREITPWTFTDWQECPMQTVFSLGQAVAILDSLETEEGTHWYQRHFSPIVNDCGEVEFVIEAMRDITDQRLLEEEKMKRVKLEGIVQMAGTAAHQLNSPLFAALGVAELLHDDLVKNGLSPAIMEDLEMIIRNMREIGTLTRQMAKVTGFEEEGYVGTTRIVKLHSEENNGEE